MFPCKNHKLQTTNSNSSAGWRHVLQQELLPKLALRRSAARSEPVEAPWRLRMFFSSRRDTSPSPSSADHHGGPAQRCQRAWGSSWEKGDGFGQIWNFYLGLFLKSAVLARGQSTGDPEQDEGSATPGQGLRRARRQGACGSETASVSPFSSSLLLGRWLTAWTCPAHQGKITNRREATPGLQRTRNKEWVHPTSSSEAGLLGCKQDAWCGQRHSPANTEPLTSHQ